MNPKAVLANAFSNRRTLKGVRAISNHLRSTRVAFIVNFHRFFESTEEMLRKGPSVHTSVSDFDKLLGLLGVRYDFISMNTLVEHLETGEPFRHDSIAITMDDGYEDNLTLGLPILRKHSVPATLYIATGFIGTTELLPMDAIDYALRSSRKLRLDWDFLGKDGFNLDGYAERCKANIAIGRIFKALPSDELEEKLRELFTRLEVDWGVEGNNMLDWDEVSSLRQAGVEIGSHGVSHRLMTRLPKAVAKQELLSSRDEICSRTGSCPAHFAYPNGMAEDFDDELREEARNLGYRSVASVVRGACKPGITDPFNLPRLGLVGTPEETMMYIESKLIRS